MTEPTGAELGKWAERIVRAHGRARARLTELAADLPCGARVAVQSLLHAAPSAVREAVDAVQEHREAWEEQLFMALCEYVATVDERRACNESLARHRERRGSAPREVAS